MRLSIMKHGWQHLLGSTVSGLAFTLLRSASAAPPNTTLVFICSRAGSYDLWRVHSDDTGLTRLATDPNHELSPRVTPEGTRIARMRQFDGSAMDLRMMNADGSGDRLIRSFPGADAVKLLHDSVWFQRRVRSVGSLFLPQLEGGAGSLE